RHTRFDCDWSSDVCSSDLSAMTPGLVEARKVGAAEMGIHPSAGLPMLQGASKGAPSSLNHSINALLRLVGKMYGVPYGQDEPLRSEERRVGKEWKARRSRD